MLFRSRATWKGPTTAKNPPSSVNNELRLRRIYVADAAAAILEFYVAMDVSNQSCGFDDLQVTVNGIKAWEKCDNVLAKDYATGSTYMKVELDLSKYAGAPVDIKFIAVAGTDAQMRAMASYRPFKSVGVLYTPTERNSVVILNELKELGAKKGFTVVERAFRHVRVDDEQMVTEFAPADFAQERCAAIAGLFVDQRPALSRRHLAKMQIGRQTRDAAARHEVARELVILDVGLREFFQSRHRRLFARPPGGAHAAGPIRFGRQKFPVVERVALQRLPAHELGMLESQQRAVIDHHDVSQGRQSIEER